MNTYNNAAKASRKFKLKILSSAILMALGTNMVYAQSSDTDITEEVVVYGIANSLKSAADFKRNSDVVVDSITAEDIGKFPDANIADSLQRVPGVQISRDRGGEGRFVSVRGLGSQFNMTTLNSRTLATDNAGRDFSFDVMPSELISQADVYKTSMASIQEGSIGGLISLKTRKPLDTPGLHVNGSLGGLYDEGTEQWGGQSSVVVSDSFHDDTLGVSLGVTYSQREWKADTYELLSAKKYVSVPANTDGNTEAVNAWMPDIPSFQHKFGERERVGVAGAIQFKPDDRIDTTVDFFYSNYKTPESSYSYNINFGTSSGIAVTDIAPWSTPSTTNDGVLIDHVVTGFTTEKSDLEIGNDTQERETDTYMIGWNTIFQATDDLKLDFDVAYSKAERPNEGDNLYTVAGLTPVSYTWNTSKSGVPKLGCTTTDGRNCWDATNDDIGIHFMELKGEQVSDEVVSLRFDGDYDFDLSGLDSVLEFGVTFSTREKDKDIYKSADGCAYCKSYTQKLDQVGINAVLPDPVRYDTGKDSGISYWPALDPYSLFAAARAFDRLEHQEGRFEEKLAPRLQDRESTLIEEEVLGAYTQLNLKSDTWNANAGLRWVQTDTTSSGHIQELVALEKISGSSNYSGTYGDSIPVTFDNTYDNLLPSASFNYEFSDNAILRTAVSQTITRPTISNLGPDLKWEINSGTPRVNFGGNPELKPIESTNYDMSFEWYDDNGMAASAAIYYKDISNWIFWGGEEVIYNLTVTEEGEPAMQQDVAFAAGKPFNGDSASLTGFELAFQQIFANGFGVQMNYTYADTESTTTVGDFKVEGELDGVSKNTYNLVGFYENDNFSTRLSYSYRDDYISAARGGDWANPKMNSDFATLDLSMSYNINENVSVYLEGQNLLEEYGQTYWGDTNATHYYEQYYRRFEIGARFKF
ncbi:TonB-dependent receptor [Cellvibrio sp.]